MFKDETVVATIQDLEGNHKKLPSLSFMGGPAMGQIHILKSGEYVIGRSKEASIVVLDDAISRQHFRLLVREDEVLLEDLGSTNGTYINGIRISKHTLQDKDAIQISSQTVISFSYVSDFEAQKQSQIYKMANFDPVTQARTKYYFLDQIAQEFSHAARRGAPLSLIFFDIDFFKQVNDSYGHPAGDYVLKKISEMTLQIIREEDLFARYGGEEFVILMRDTVEKDAIGLAERLRKTVAQHTFHFEEATFKVTISFGIATLVKDNHPTFHALIQSADQYLYFAKQNGRNRVAALSLLAPSK